MTKYFSLLYFLYLFMTQSSFSNSEVKPKYLVLLPSTLNPRYLFPLPLAVESWKRLGVQPVVLLVGNKAGFMSNRYSQETIRLLEEQKAYIEFYEPEELPAVSFSQLIRLFGSVLNFAFNYVPEETVLISSDADLIVFQLSNHIPNVTEGKKIHFYNSQCLEPITVPFLRGTEKVHQYPMGTIGATIAAWREIMGFDHIPYTIKDIEDYVFKEFGNNFFNHDEEVQRGSDLWFADQSLISYKVHQWFKNPENEIYKSEKPEYPKRINRNSWPAVEEFSKMDPSKFDDAHLPSAAYSNDEWDKFYPFLKFAFKDDQYFIDRYVNYRNQFVNY